MRRCCPLQSSFFTWLIPVIRSGESRQGRGWFRVTFLSSDLYLTREAMAAVTRAEAPTHPQPHPHTGSPAPADLLLLANFLNKTVTLREGEVTRTWPWAPTQGKQGGLGHCLEDMHLSPKIHIFTCILEKYANNIVCQCLCNMYSPWSLITMIFLFVKWGQHFNVIYHDLLDARPLSGLIPLSVIDRHVG